VKEHPEIMWCYYHWDPCPTYLLSKRYPLFKYNIFLNQSPSCSPLGEDARNSIASRGKGQINLPATFLAGDTLSRIFPVQKRTGIQIETRSLLLMKERERESLSAFGPVSGGDGMRYSTAFRQTILKRVLSPGHAPVSEFPAETGVSIQTIYKWIHAAERG